MNVSVSINNGDVVITTHNETGIAINDRRKGFPPAKDIRDMAIASKMFLLVLEDEDLHRTPLAVYEENRPHNPNNVIAFDFNGKPLWNIADLIGDNPFPIVGGAMVSCEWIRGIFDAPPTIAGHEYFLCGDHGGRTIIVDITDTKVIYNKMWK